MSAPQQSARDSVARPFPLDLNAAIADLLKRINEGRPLRRLGRTRRQLFEDLDRTALKPLPVEPYVFAQWRVCRIGVDYHVEVDKHFYSVPHRFARAEVEVRLTNRSNRQSVSVPLGKTRRRD